MNDILEAFPEYATTSQLDELRRTEYSYLDEQDHLYLDYTGAGLAANGQYTAHADRLRASLSGNPHSANPTSEAATALVEKTRERILAHFHADPAEYTVVFTQNATGAARLVAESYPFRRSSKLVLTFDNHNSVNGIREYAGRRGATTVHVPSTTHDLRVDTNTLMAALGPPRAQWKANSSPDLHRSATDLEKKTLIEGSRAKSSTMSLSLAVRMMCSMGIGGVREFRRVKANTKASAAKEKKRGLFAYPAQSNFSGVRHPLSWIPLAQARGYDVLLDAAAYLPTGTLDLSGSIKPEFVLVSWYKLFGYPTGVGCLIARRDALTRLNRPWFSGGTIQAVSVGLPWHVMAQDESAFEDGTLNFLSIPDVQVGLDWLATVGMSTIQTRVRCLTGWLLYKLSLLSHSNGCPMIKIYGPVGTEMRGGNVCFNFLDAEGKIVDERLVAGESAAARISLRTGCFCNPGCGEDAFGLNLAALKYMFVAGTTSMDAYIQKIGMPSAGAIRVSFGVASTLHDLDRFLAWAEATYRDRVTSSIGLAPRERC